MEYARKDHGKTPYEQRGSAEKNEEKQYLDIWDSYFKRPSFMDKRISYTCVRLGIVIAIIVTILSLTFLVTTNLIISLLSGTILGGLFLVVFHEGFGDVRLWVDLHFKTLAKLKIFSPLWFFTSKAKGRVAFMVNKRDLTTTGLGMYQVEIIPENVAANFTQFAGNLNTYKIPFTYQIVQAPYDPLSARSDSHQTQIGSLSSYMVSIYMCCFHSYKGMPSRPRLEYIEHKVENYLLDLKTAFGAQFSHYKMRLLKGRELEHAIRCFFFQKELPEIQAPPPEEEVLDTFSLLGKLLYVGFIITYIDILLAFLRVPAPMIIIVSGILFLVLMFGLWKGLLSAYSQQKILQNQEYHSLYPFQGLEPYYCKAVPKMLLLHINRQILVALRAYNLQYAHSPLHDSYNPLDKVFRSIIRQGRPPTYTYTVSVEPEKSEIIRERYLRFFNPRTYQKILSLNPEELEQWLELRNGLFRANFTMTAFAFRYFSDMENTSQLGSVLEQLHQDLHPMKRSIKKAFMGGFNGFYFWALQKKLLVNGLLFSLTKSRHFRLSGSLLYYNTFQGKYVPNLVYIPSELKKGVETRIAAEFNSPLSLENHIVIGKTYNLEIHEDEVDAGFTEEQVRNILLTNGSAKLRDRVIQKILIGLITSNQRALIFDFWGEYSRLIRYFENTRFARDILHFKVGKNLNIDLLNSGLTKYDKQNNEYLQYMFDACALAFKKDLRELEAFKSIITQYQGMEHETDLHSILLDQQGKPNWEKNGYENSAISFINMFAQNALILSKDKETYVGTHQILMEDRTVIIDLSGYKELEEKVFIQFVFLAKYVHYLNQKAGVPEKIIVTHNLDAYFDAHYMGRRSQTEYGKMDKFLMPLVERGPGMIATLNNIHYVHTNILGYFNNIISHKAVEGSDLSLLKNIMDLQELQGAGYYSKSRNNTYQIQFLLSMHEDEILVKRSDINQAFPVHLYLEDLLEVEPLTPEEIQEYMKQQGFDQKAAEKLLLEQAKTTLFEKDLGNYYALIHPIKAFLNGVKAFSKVALYRTKLEEGLMSALYGTLSQKTNDKAKMRKIRDTILDLLIKHEYLIESHPKNAAGGESLRSAYKVGSKFDKAVEDEANSKHSVKEPVQIEAQGKSDFFQKWEEPAPPKVDIIEEVHFKNNILEEVAVRLLTSCALPLKRASFKNEEAFRQAVAQRQSRFQDFLMSLMHQVLTHDSKKGISSEDLDLAIATLGRSSSFPFSKEEILDLVQKSRSELTGDAAILEGQIEQLDKLYSDFCYTLYERIKNPLESV